MAPKTVEQKLELIKELRELVKEDVSHKDFLTDGYLLLWLKEKKFVPKKAAKRIRETMKWRADNDIDNVFNETHIDDSWTPAHHQQAGFDPEGRPIYVGFALLDIIEEKRNQIESDEELRDQFTPDKLYELIKEHEKNANMEAIMRYAYYYMEYALKLLRELDLFNKKSSVTGEPLHGAVILADCKGADMVEKELAFADFVKYCTLIFPYAVDLYKVFSLHYPGLIHGVYMVNAPKRMAKFAINMARPVVRGDLLDRVHVYGKKPAKWMPALHEKFGPENLLERFGGTLPLGENYFKNAGKYIPDPKGIITEFVKDATELLKVYEQEGLDKLVTKISS